MASMLVALMAPGATPVSRRGVVPLLMLSRVPVKAEAMVMSPVAASWRKMPALPVMMSPMMSPKVVLLL